ncbi:hypothetical protein LTR86_000679 [Recurvomyces mirabilis]|nr:hypothetical protein LTR86_000679 [Recurvomyces mirabilis]
MAYSCSQLHRQLRAMRIGEGQTSKSPEESNDDPDPHNPLDSSHPQEELPEDEWLRYLPDDLTAEARMQYWMLEQARLDYEHNNFSSCHERCAELLSFTSLPKYAHILALHLVSGVVPIYYAQHMLQDALDMCDQLESDQGKNETINLLRDKTKALLQVDREEQEEAREESEESQDASGAEDGGIWLDDADEDAMMVDEFPR